MAWLAGRRLSLDFASLMWPAGTMRQQPTPYPTDRPTLDREYSPSHLVDSLDRYLDAYARRSEAARGWLRPIALQYGPHHRQRLDYFAAEGQGLPLVVFIHGGFWCALDERSFSFPATGLLKAGVNYAAVTYRLAPEASISEITADAGLALQWLRANAAGLGFDPSRLVLVGHSAGAHLAAMIMANTRMPVLAGAVLISGVYDLAPIRRSYVNDSVGITEREIELCSPAGLTPKHRCNTAVVVGDIETGEFKRQSRLLVDCWREFLPSCSFGIIEDRNHFDILFDLAESKSTLFNQVLTLTQETKRQ